VLWFAFLYAAPDLTATLHGRSSAMWLWCYAVLYAQWLLVRSPQGRVAGEFLMTGIWFASREAISRARPDRCVRLPGTAAMPASQTSARDPSARTLRVAVSAVALEAVGHFTHPTAFDPRSTGPLAQRGELEQIARP